MRDLIYFWREVGVPAISIWAVIVVPVFLIANMYDAYVCSSYGDITGTSTRHRAFDTCYIEHRGEWLRYSAYEQAIIARDGLE